MAAVRIADAPRTEVVNGAYLERFGTRCPGEIDDGSFDHRSNLGAIERELVRAADAGASKADTVYKTTATGRRSFAVRAIPAERAGLAAFLEYRDITEDRIRDQQLAVLRRVLRHDLRNDLTVLLGYAETIVETAENPQIREHAATMLEAAGDLRTVATSAGRMQSVTAAAESTVLGDAITEARRAVASDTSSRLTIGGRVPSGSVDRSVAVALEELCRTLADRDTPTDVDLSVDTADGWATISLDADAALGDQERAALEGRDETKLRHATGISPWIARWAVRAAGGRMDVDVFDDGCSITVATPLLDVVRVDTSKAGFPQGARPWAND